MAHQIALALGMPVFIMKQILPTDEYLNWIRYFQFKAPDVQEQQMAILMTMVSTGLGAKTKPKVTDFLLSNTAKPSKTDSIQAMRANLGM